MAFGAPGRRRLPRHGDAVGVRVDDEDGDARDRAVRGLARRRHQDGVRHQCGRDAGLGAREEPGAVGLGRRRRGGLGPTRQDHLADELGQGGGEDGLAARHTGEPRLALRIGAEARDGHGAVDHGLDDGHVGRSATGRLNHETRRDEVEPRAPDVLAQVDAEEAGAGELPPQAAVERPLVARLRLELLQPFVRRPFAEDLPGQLADGLLLFAVVEVHGISSSGGLSAATAACRGRRSR